jgi:hypothetical protein
MLIKFKICCQFFCWFYKFLKHFASRKNFCWFLTKLSYEFTRKQMKNKESTSFDLNPQFWPFNNWWVNFFVINFIKIIVRTKFEKLFLKFCWKIEHVKQENSGSSLFKMKNSDQNGFESPKLTLLCWCFFWFVQQKIMKIYSKPIISLSIDN